MENVTRARTEGLGARTIGEKAKASEALSSAVGNLFAVAENYPNLKASENYLALQKRLTGLENEIADRREFYNDSVNNFNVRIQQFPDVLLAGPLGFKPREMFKVNRTLPNGYNRAKISALQYLVNVHSSNDHPKTAVIDKGQPPAVPASSHVKVRRILRRGTTLPVTPVTVPVTVPAPVPVPSEDHCSWGDRCTTPSWD